jgi:hypothetical protein
MKSKNVTPPSVASLSYPWSGGVAVDNHAWMDKLTKHANATRVVASVADLIEADIPATDKTCMTVLGYCAAGVGGGGWFVWNLGSSVAEDAGTVFASTESPNAGRWIRAVNGPVSALWFGVKNDGSDSTSAMANVYAYGGRVVFPAGSYKTTQPITIAKNNVNWIGEEAGTTSWTYAGAAGTFAVTIQHADSLTAQAEPFLINVGLCNFTFALNAATSAVRAFLVTKGVFRNLRCTTGINDNAGLHQPVFSFEGGVANVIEDLYARGDAAPLTTKAAYLFKFIPAAWGAGQYAASSNMTNCRIHGVYGSGAKRGFLLSTYSAIHELTAETCEEYGVEVGYENFCTLHSPWFEYNGTDILLNALFNISVVGNLTVEDPFSAGSGNLVDAQCGTLYLKNMRRYQLGNAAPLFKAPSDWNGWKRLYLEVDDLPPTAKLLTDASWELENADPFMRVTPANFDANAASFGYQQVRIRSQKEVEIPFIGPVNVTGAQTLTTAVGADSYRLLQSADVLGIYFCTASGASGKAFSNFTLLVNGEVYFTDAGARSDGVGYVSYPRRIQLAANDVLSLRVTYDDANTADPIEARLILGLKPRYSMNAT